MPNSTLSQGRRRAGASKNKGNSISGRPASAKAAKYKECGSLGMKGYRVWGARQKAEAGDYESSWQIFRSCRRGIIPSLLGKSCMFMCGASRLLWALVG